MQETVGFIVLGTIIALVGGGLIALTDGGIVAFFGLLIAVIGGVMAQVGVIATGVVLGLKESRAAALTK